MIIINSKLYIIPNEDILETGTFFRVLKKDDKHLKYIKEFSSLNNLDYSFTDDDSNIAPRMLALDGHLVVKTSWDFMKIALFYIPKKLQQIRKSG